MSSIAISVAAGGIASLVGKGVLTQAVGDTSSYLLSFARSSVVDDHPRLTSVLEDLDIDASMNVIKALLKETPDHYEKEGSLHICIHNLNDVVENIQDTLVRINEEVNFHETRWFNKMRTPRYGIDIDRLVRYKKILLERLDIFIQLLQIPKSTCAPRREIRSKFGF